MKSSKFISTNNIGWIIIVLAMIILYYSYYFIYIPQQETALKQRAFRILKEYGNNMHDKKDYYNTHLANYRDYYILDYLSNQKSTVSEVIREKAYASSKWLKEIKKVIGDLDTNISIQLVDTSKNYRSGIYKDKNTADFYLKFFNSGNEYIKKTQQSENKIFKILISKDYKLFKDKTIVQKIPVETLMEGLKFDRLLDNIVFFDSKAVMYNTSKDAVQDITNIKMLTDSVKNHQGGIFLSVDVRGAEKYMMIVPIDFQGDQYFLAGFLSEKDFNRKTRAINSQFIIIVGALILLILIGIPVLKVLFINKFERLHAYDATNATVSLILGTGLLVLIMISLLKHYVIDSSRMEKRANDLSEQLIKNVDSDINKAVKMYFSIRGFYNDSNEVSMAARTYFLDTKSKFKKINFDSITPPIPVNEILLANRKGIVVEAYTKTPFSSDVPIDIGKRKYFRYSCASGDGWPLSSRIKEIRSATSKKKAQGSNQPIHTNDSVVSIEKTTPPIPPSSFYIESITSLNTGKQETAISFHLPFSDTLSKVNDSACVLAITSHIPSLYKQVLPEDVNFVMINEEGEVLFHSKHNKNLHENFLDECNRNSNLMSAIEHRVSTTELITYNEKSWLARIVPLKDAPLYHITLIDTAYTQNINARIFLYSFYFFLITVLCIVLGMQIMQRIEPRHRFVQMKGWSYSWLYFRANNRFAYKALLAVQIVIFIFQVIGIFIVDKPVTMLVYQLAFIAYSGFAGFSILRNRKAPILNFYHRTHWDTTLKLIITSAVVLLLIPLQPGFLFLIPLIVFFVLSLFIHYVIEIAGSKESDLKGFDKVIFDAFGGNEINRQEKADKGEEKELKSLMFTRKIYHSYMFIWLAGLSIVPVFQYYLKIKHCEHKLSLRHNMEYVAHQNLNLLQNYSPQDSLWYKHIRGGGLDNLTVSDETDSSLLKKEKSATQTVDYIYSSLPDPITPENHLKALILDHSYHDEWKTKDKTLYYSRAGIDGFVKVKYNPVDSKLPVNATIIITLLTLLIAALIWILYRYLADNILNTIRTKWKVPSLHPWEKILDDEKIHRILLNIFYEKPYIKGTTDYLNNKDEKVVEIHAEDMLGEKYNFPSDISDPKTLIWVTGLDNMIRRLKNHENIQDKLIELNNNAKARIIITIPFELEFIYDYYEDYITDNELEKSEKSRLYILKQTWKNIFADYFKYTGKPEYISKETESGSTIENGLPIHHADEKLYGVKSSMEAKYQYIWSNLTAAEKLVLYDLADDGMLNLKNKYLINKLVMKGLIVYKPYPRLFSDSFQYYLRFSVKPEETLRIERKLGKRGKWKNMRFLLLLFIIPLAGFVFIAQGISFDKVIGIFAGVLALLSGLMRFLDGGVIGKSGG
ncbi:MAG: hypothetical protein KDC05_08700 [Bacteroidales bacterium]|nr:hypothetical protein [Bacteroidales bacterium]